MSAKYPVKRYKYGDWVIWLKLSGCRANIWQARNRVTKQYVNLAHRKADNWTVEQVKAFLDNPDNVAANAEFRARYMEETVRKINALYARIKNDNLRS